MSDEKSGVSIGFTGLLTLVFITLKLCKVIDWPWFWVLSPVWITIAVVLLFIIGAFLIELILKKKKRW